MKKRLIFVLLTALALAFAVGMVSVYAEDELPDKYITFDGFFGELPNGDTEYIVEVENYGDTLVLPENTFNREGYYFYGWAYQYKLYQPGDEIIAEEDAAVSALFINPGSKSIVSFNSALGSFGTFSFDGDEAEIESPYDDFASYDEVDAWFEGWNTEPDGSGTYYNPGQVVTLDADEVLVLYAIWNTDLSKAYKVTFDPNFEGETDLCVENGHIYVKKGDSLITKSNASLDGYEFAGYYDKPEGGNFLCGEEEEFTPKKDTVLYAHWNKQNAITVNSPKSLDVYVAEWATPGTTVYVYITPAWDSEPESISAVDAEGNNVNMQNEDNEYVYSFVMPESDVTLELTAEKDVPDNPFADVDEDDYFFDPVLWAIKNDVTTGIDAKHFGSGKNVSRAQMLTFLWRLAGSPEPGIKDCDFIDVDEDDYFYNAVLWAVEEGITKGTSATKFSPDMAVNRAQAVTLIARYNCIEEDEDMYSCDFVDVKDDDYFKAAVAWASETGVTKGIDDTHFGPNEICLRSQAITLLFRTFAYLADGYEDEE